MEVLATGEALAAADLTTGGEMVGALGDPGVTEREALGLPGTEREVLGLDGTVKEALGLLGSERGALGIGTERTAPKEEGGRIV